MSALYLTSLTVASGNPGDRFTTVIRGDVLTSANEVSFGPQITIVNFSVLNDGEIKVKIDIAEDAHLGPRDVVVSSPTGSGTLVNGFTVS